MAFGSEPGDWFGWEGDNEDLQSGQDTYLAGQFAQQWKLRMRARAAAESKLRRLLEYGRSFNCRDIPTGDSFLFYKAQKRKRSPRRRGLAKILKIDETGLAAMSQGQTFQVARYCVRKTADCEGCG